MMNAQYIAMSKLSAMRQQMDVIANNVANMNTSGFKSEDVLFEEFLVKNDVGETFSYVLDTGVVRNLADGPLTHTGNPLDVAIQGNAYFVVDTPAGERYTRNGHFTLDGTGTLVTKSGAIVLDEDGGQIVIAPDDGEIFISSDGTISGQGGALEARLQLVSFNNERAMKKIGNGLYATDEAPAAAQGAKIVQRNLEGSNVNSILQMSRMVEVLRNYQAAQRLLDGDNDLQRRTIERLGEVN